MNFDPAELKSLAAVLVDKGIPVLATLIGGPIGPIVALVVPQIAKAFGLSEDSPPAAIAVAVAAAPDASEKLADLEAHNKAIQAYIDSEISADQALVLPSDSFWQRFLIAGARPMMMWVCGPVVLLYQLTALRFGWTIVPFDFFAAVQATFASLAGFRTVEKWKGVDTMVLTKPVASAAPPKASR